MKSSLPNTQIKLMLALAALFAGAVAIVACALTPLFYLEVSMTSSRGRDAHVVYDLGAGINERDSARLTLQGAPGTLYRFALPQAEYRALQFYPVDRGDCEVAIQSVRIVDLSGRVVRDFSPIEVVAGHDRAFFTGRSGSMIRSNN